MGFLGRFESVRQRFVQGRESAIVMESDPTYPAAAKGIGDEGTFHLLGVAAYVLDNDPEEFRRYLSAVGHRQLTFIQRFDAGLLDEYFAPYSTASLLFYRELYDALAAADFATAQALAGTMGTQESPERVDTAFTRAMGFALKWTVLGDDGEQTRAWIERLRNECSDSQHGDFRGYAELLDAALHMICDGHQRLAQNPDWFGDSENELLCVWGIGAANLCRWRGLNVSAVPPLIPDALLCPVGASQSGP
jgi:hypothetical protein